MHPLLILLVTKPQLLVDHAQAYAALCHEDLGLARNAWQKQLVWQAVALCSLSVAVVLGGVALMLWAVTPVAQMHAPWVLWLAPAVPLCMAVLANRRASQHSRCEAFANLSRQISADLALLRAVATP
ncbi:MAG: hypothetical protein FD135_3615 [Comamonadaceae bacterium]|nr:MAG: hypothetical protein FD135_3615 [Comamonadaceae bacterium]